jgi:hypothetical protein
MTIIKSHSHTVLFVSDGKMALSVIRINLHNFAILFFVLRLSEVERYIVCNYFTVYIKSRSKQEMEF